MQVLSIIEFCMFEKYFGIFFLPCDDVIVIDNVKHFEARFFVSNITYADGQPVSGFKPSTEISKFLIFVHTYNHRRVHNCTKKMYVHFTYPTSKMECLS